ncbi:MAG TPA: hypothetical protein VFP28_11810 [Gemmatimonadales bacterium]|jgi:hypothetical protein|nr:hypothetical protein [Gemmatimonadales bacterium]
MMLPTRSLLAVLALAVGALPCAAQSAAPDSGTFVIRHASDTVALEHFSRTATSLEGTLAMRDHKGTAQRYQAVVAPDASVALIEVTVQEQPDSGQKRARVIQRARVIFKEDSAAVDDVTNHGLQTRLFGTERGAVPYLNLSFALLEQAVRRSRAVDPAGKQVPLFNLGGGQTLDAKLSPIGADSLAVAIGSVEFHLRVDQTGRVLGGRIPAQEVVVDRLGS